MDFVNTQKPGMISRPTPRNFVVHVRVLDVVPRRVLEQTWHQGKQRIPTTPIRLHQ